MNVDFPAVSNIERLLISAIRTRYGRATELSLAAGISRDRIYTCCSDQHNHRFHLDEVLGLIRAGVALGYSEMQGVANLLRDALITGEPCQLNGLITEEGVGAIRKLAELLDNTHTHRVADMTNTERVAALQTCGEALQLLQGLREELMATAKDNQ